MAGPSGAARGGAYGLLAASLFGLSVPLSKLLLSQASPLVLAGLLYVGGGVGLMGMGAIRRVGSKRSRRREAPLEWRDLPLLLGIVSLGGVAGPVLMLTGLERLSGVAGALLLNLEGPLTVVVAVVLFREHLGRSGVLATAAVFIGAAVLGLEEGSFSGDPFSVLAIMGACLAWAVDNNLTQRLTLKDPLAIARVKCLSAGLCALGIATWLGQEIPSAKIVLSAGLVGFFSYGLSLLFDTYALRLIGAAREAAFFATAPFIGAVASLPLLGESLRGLQVVAAGLMILGVVLLVREKHSHLHVHAPLVHEHLHSHDEHHQHSHPDGRGDGPHSHPHRHEELTHEHPHVSDVHHRHRHD